MFEFIEESPSLNFHFIYFVNSTLEWNLGNGVHSNVIFLHKLHSVLSPVKYTPKYFHKNTLGRTKVI